jgi:lipoprotein NlpD
MWAALLLAAVLAGCASKYPLNQAPVEDRAKVANKPAPAAPAAAVEAPAPVKLAPGAENAGKPGYYTVKPGDTLIRIGLDSGQNWRDIARWNKLENPNQLDVGQVLQVVLAPPLASTSESGVVTRPVASTSVAPVQAGSAPTHSVPPPVAASAALASSSTHGGDEELVWLWPGNGALLRGFDEVSNKGLDLGGKLGDPVFAAMDERLRAQPDPAGEGRPERAQGAEDCRNGQQRLGPGQAAFRDPSAGQAGGPRQVLAGALGGCHELAGPGL